MSDAAPTQTKPVLPDFDPSGQTQTSGVMPSGSYTGPFFVETQTMQIDYYRVPDGRMHSVSCTIAGVQSIDHVTYGSKIAATVQASHTSAIDHGAYSTSSFIQPQKFEILAASTDSTGNTYGEINASCLGPAGQIVTYQPYYSRVPWDNAIHGSVSGGSGRSCLGRNYYASVSAFDQGLSAMELVTHQVESFEHDPANWFNQNANVRGSLNEIVNTYGNTGGAMSSRLALQIPIANLYQAGSFSTSGESLYLIRGFVDSIGMKVSQEGLYANPATVTEVGNTFGNAVGDVGISFYSHTRHDWS